MGTHEETREFIDRVKRYQNPYPKPFAKVHIPNQAVGAWRVQRYVVTEQDVMIDNLRSAMDGKAHRIIPPGAYTRLGTVGCPPGFVMSDTPAEAHEHMEVIHATRQAIHRLTNGHGVRVLINGLGIGMVLQALLTYEQVEYIRVIEVQPEVIQMVAPRYRQPRVDIVEADALEYKPDKGEKFDVVWHDIWPEALNDDTWDQCKALHRKYGKIAEWQGSWSRAYYEQERRREYRGYGWCTSGEAMDMAEERQYSEAILLSQQAKAELDAAKRRYHAAMQECLPPGTLVRYFAHNGRKYDGVITKPMSHSGYVTLRSLHTGREYEVALHFIEGLS